MLAENKALKKALNKISRSDKKKLKGVVDEIPVDDLNDLMPSKVNGVEPMDVDKFDPYIPEDNFFAEYDGDKLSEIVSEQKKMIKFLKKHGYSKATSNRILILFDDLVGSPAFSAQRSNPYKILSANHRHSSLSTISLVQAYKELMKTARTQLSGLILFRSFNEKELEVIREEYPMSMHKDDWCEVYDYCTKEPFDFLYYNIRGKIREAQVMKNFDEYIVTPYKPLKF
jgi:hypothetical protein